MSSARRRSRNSIGAKPLSKDRVTSREVAELAGVSVSAVSRVFTQGASASPATREKVLNATRALGYQPNLLARSLITKRTDLIGLVSNNFNNPAFMEIFDLFTQRLQHHGLKPLLVNLTNGVAPGNAMEMLLQYSVDGVIVASSELHRYFAKACLEARLPFVQAFGRPIGNLPINTIAADNIQGGLVAGDLLCARGYRRVAFLGGPRSATSTEDRLRGFRSRLLKDELRPVAEVFGSSFSYETGKVLMTELLSGARPDAIFCGDDVLAMGAIDACREAELAVPADIGILGFDDIALASWSAYHLTTVRQPIAEIIIAAVEMVLSVIDQPQRTPERRVFACEPIVRATLRATPAAEADLPGGKRAYA
jgi:DNA-binding LacI/PurR family transcriptional regulator